MGSFFRLSALRNLKAIVACDVKAFATNGEYAAAIDLGFNALVIGIDAALVHPHHIGDVPFIKGRFRIEVIDRKAISAAYILTEAEFAVVPEPDLGRKVEGKGPRRDLYTLDNEFIIIIHRTLHYDQADLFSQGSCGDQYFYIALQGLDGGTFRAYQEGFG